MAKAKPAKPVAAPAPAIERHVRLTYTQPPSNKEYQVDLVRVDEGWVVNFAYGRIGTTLKTGTKTAEPLDYATASKICFSLVADKQREGYALCGESPDSATYQAPVAKEDTGLRPQLLEPITLDQVDPFIRDEQWWMQPKFDGNRVFIVASAGGVSGANRKGQKISLPLPLVEAVKGLAWQRELTLDGELIGENYFAFDILKMGDKALGELAYALRYALLTQVVGAANRSNLTCAPVAKTEMEKVAMLAKLQAEHAEGVVFKAKEAPYVPGRRPTQVKCKFWESATFIVTSTSMEPRSIGLGLLEPDGRVASWGNCGFPTTRDGKRIVFDLPRVGGLVEVTYLYVDDNAVQPKFKCLRDDVERADCTRAQLKFKPGSRYADASVSKV